MADDFSENEKRGLYKAIYSRRDVRSHFTANPIKDDILSKILHAAHHAPSVGFSQPWNFILIKDDKTKKKIKESFDEEKREIMAMVVSTVAAHVTAAMAAITPLATSDMTSTTPVMMPK